MKKIITTLTLITLLIVPMISLAGLGDVTVEESIPESQIKNIDQVLGIMDTIGGYIFSALLILASIFLVMAGWLFVTAGGDPSKPVQARDMLRNALIGVAIAFGARGLIAVIQNLVESA